MIDRDALYAAFYKGQSRRGVEQLKTQFQEHLLTRRTKTEMVIISKCLGKETCQCRGRQQNKGK